MLGALAIQYPLSPTLLDSQKSCKLTHWGGYSLAYPGLSRAKSDYTGTKAQAGPDRPPARRKKKP